MIDVGQTTEHFVKIDLIYFCYYALLEYAKWSLKKSNTENIHLNTEYFALSWERILPQIVWTCLLADKQRKRSRDIFRIFVLLRKSTWSGLLLGARKVIDRRYQTIGGGVALQWFLSELEEDIIQKDTRQMLEDEEYVW